MQNSVSALQSLVNYVLHDLAKRHKVATRNGSSVTHNGGNVKDFFFFDKDDWPTYVEQLDYIFKINSNKEKQAIIL